MEVFFVRHGESEQNAGNIHQHPDIPLSKNGIKQAEILAKRLTDIKFDFIYASTNLRAKQTAEIIKKKINTPIEFWDDIVEWRTPSELEGKFAEDPEAVKIKDQLDSNLNRKNYRYSDEETFEELTGRALKVIKHLEKNHNDQTILCVSHGTIIKTIVAKMIFRDELTAKILFNIRKRTWIKNTGITHCELSEKYGWTLVTWNDTTHL